MRITVYGSGYVGLVTAACLAETGNRVLCVDIDEHRIDRLKRGESPIHEAGLQELLAVGLAARRLEFTTNPRRGVEFGEFQFIAVGTPAAEDGSADISHVLSVARAIGRHMNEHRLIVVKSTVPVGTSDRVRAATEEALGIRGVAAGVDVVANPEFLREGAAVADFRKPHRIILGSGSQEAVDRLKAVYKPFHSSPDQVIVMDARSAELTKYAANAMLATKISLVNELALLAEGLGADIEHVRKGIGPDPRIGFGHLRPGCGYGGSCLPKDVNALVALSGQSDDEMDVLKAVERVNRKQRRLLFERISAYFKGCLEGRVIALWGLSFKPGTDDMREASSRVLMEQLWSAGATVRAYDPVAMDEARRLYPGSEDLILCQSAEEAVQGAHALAVVTEWQEFRNPDFAAVRKSLRTPAIFDGRNIFQPAEIERHGFEYFGIGRGASSAESSS